MLFHSWPAGFEADVQAAGCVVECNGEVLLLQSNGKKPHKAFRWGSLAERLEAGESPLDAIVRELNEETGLSVPAGEVVFLRRFSWFTPRVAWSTISSCCA